MKEDVVSKTKILIILILTVPLFSSNSFANYEYLTSNSQSTRTTEWILDLQANDLNNTQWYFDHLNNDDRKKIRQAFDWAIPRDFIINNIKEGLVIPTLSSVSPYASPLINSGPNPRTYNLTKALDLLTEVFGYRFNQYTDNVATDYDEIKPYFQITLLVPTNMLKRIEFASEVKLSWQKIGIKVYLQDYEIGNLGDFRWSTKDFDHGGFDAFFVETTVPSHIPFQILGDRVLDPTLGNYINISMGLNWEPNVTKRGEALLKYQEWMYDNVPISYLFRQLAVNAKNENLQGFNPFTQFNYENWTYPGNDSIVIALSASWVFQNLNPIFYYANQLDSYHDWLDPETKYAMGSLFRGMFFSTTEEKDNSFTQWKTYPYFADWYNTSVDGLTWFVNLKEGLKWHDGVDLNASDVEFTFNTILQNYTDTTEYLQWDYSTLVKNFTVFNSTLMRFEFKHTWLIKETFLSTTILPKHILENIPISEWSNHTSNTGLNGGVIGNGPYTFVNASGDFTSINLQKWDYWNDSYNTLIKNNKMDEPVPGATVPSINNLEFIIDYNGSDIVNGIKNGSIDISLGNYIWFKDISFSDQIASPAELILIPSVATQQLNYNIFSPVWGIWPIKTESNSTSTTTTSESISSTSSADFDIFGLFGAIVTIAIISVNSKRKKIR